jgi:hypothetical protein
VAALVLAGACVVVDSPRSDTTPTLVLHDGETASRIGAVEVVGLDRATAEAVAPFHSDDARWTDVLDVRVAGGSESVAGRYELLDDRIRFTPRFEPVRGQPYEIRFVPAGGGEAFDTIMMIARSDHAEPTSVAAIHPGVDTIPMNLLRAYIQFSAAMSEGEAYERIKLLDASGEPVPDPFLVLEHELWNSDRTRFTLLFDPGRIKRGLVPNEDLGLPLRQGNDYALVIDGNWADAHGNALTGGRTWTFHAGPVDRASPRVEDWSINPPSAGTREPVHVDAGERLDHALLERLITVRDATGIEIRGEVKVSGGGSVWSFTPESSWVAGDYALQIGTELEDQAGNNLRHHFDDDRSDRRDTGVTSEYVSIPLVVK